MELKVVCNCKVVCNIGKWCAILESGVHYWKVVCNIGKWHAIGKLVCKILESGVQ